MSIEVRDHGPSVIIVVQRNNANSKRVEATFPSIIASKLSNERSKPRTKRIDVLSTDNIVLVVRATIPAVLHSLQIIRGIALQSDKPKDVLLRKAGRRSGRTLSWQQLKGISPIIWTERTSRFRSPASGAFSRPSGTHGIVGNRTDPSDKSLGYLGAIPKCGYQPTAVTPVFSRVCCVRGLEFLGGFGGGSF